MQRTTCRVGRTSIDQVRMPLGWICDIESDSLCSSGVFNLPLDIEFKPRVAGLLAELLVGPEINIPALIMSMTVDHEKGFQPNTQNESHEDHDRDVSSSIDRGADAGEPEPETEPEPVVAFKTWVVAFVCSQFPVNLSILPGERKTDKIDPLLWLWPVVLACPRRGCYRHNDFTRAGRSI